MPGYPPRKEYSNLTDEQISKLKKLMKNDDKKSGKDKKNYKQEPFKPLLNENKFNKDIDRRDTDPKKNKKMELKYNKLKLKVKNLRSD